MVGPGAPPPPTPHGEAHLYIRFGGPTSTPTPPTCQFVHRQSATALHPAASPCPGGWSDRRPLLLPPPLQPPPHPIAVPPPDLRPTARLGLSTAASIHADGARPPIARPPRTLHPPTRYDGDQPRVFGGCHDAPRVGLPRPGSPLCPSESGSRGRGRSLGRGSCPLDVDEIAATETWRAFVRRFPVLGVYHPVWRADEEPTASVLRGIPPGTRPPSPQPQR